MCQSTNIRAVIFDMGGVLIPSPGLLFKDYEAAYNMPAGSLVKTIVASGDNGAWAQLERGELNISSFVHIFEKEYYKEVYFVQLLPKMIQYFSKGDPYQKMIGAIKCLRKNSIKTALLTNNCLLPDETTFMPLDQSLFDVAIESAKVGMRKPEERIYTHTLEQLNVAPQQTVFLDDLVHNLKAASLLGILTVKVESPKQAIESLEKIIGFPLDGSVTKVTELLQIDVDKFEEFLNNQLHIKGAEKPTLMLFEHGQSNPTYLVKYADQKFVLRKKPPGKLLASAHAIDREYLVMRALSQHTTIPLPQVFCYCEDESVLGTSFYVMQYLDGIIFKDCTLPGVPADMKRKVINQMCDVLSQLHKVDLQAVGLQNFGPKGSYISRNISRWLKQYKFSLTMSSDGTTAIDELNHMSDIAQWLQSRIPTDEKTSLVHGDFRLDNLIFNRTTYDLIGLIDWEMSTLGDPLTDLANSCLMYVLPENQLAPSLNLLSEDQLQREGIPTLKEYTKRYFSNLGQQPPSNWDFYLVFIYFRLAAILQGVHKRFLQGQSSSTNAHLARALAEELCRKGYQLIQRSELTSSSSSASVDFILSDVKNSSANAKNDVIAPMHVSLQSLPENVRQLHMEVHAFIEKRILPIERSLYEWHSDPKTKWTIHPMIEELKLAAKSQGLWNLFIPKELDHEAKYGKGLTNVEYAFLAEEMGWSMFAPEVFNCSAPDTGNMEVLLRYGDDEQKQKWLLPLLNGSIRSCFAMTEPAVASSDATNIESSIERVGHEYVINGHKWWTSGALDPRCKVIIFMGKTNKHEATHKQQSMVLVPVETKGISVVRPLNVFGFDDAPHGHAEVTFTDVRVPLTNVILGEGSGFEIAQGRLGPGRIHHCMRILGAAERCLQLAVIRAQERVAFGEPLIEQGSIQQDIARSRIDIERGRLLVLKAAHMMDCVGNKKAALEIAMIKAHIPRMGCQIFGGKGVCQDVVLSHMYAFTRSLCLADGPDEVHLRTIAKLERKKHSKL
ncbi:hypothetical protein HELRODRAFT_106578 [Helobdella robusta]|uniref:Acyl-CoA dehydrogenase family member 10 n=1 Tax=Helobdella robusta TaxID=6412 RepID=T1EE35_HELRO|nr:hypothetical protein HELRODRAFT_106578 [Helobdella robusta]ESO02304.1 hypothetical protein HELRODRAFT_106578 [Helobdella robusta]